MSDASSDQFSVVPWGPRRGVIMAVIALIVGQVAAGLLLLLALQPFGVSPQVAERWSQMTLGQFILIVVAESLTLFILWLFVRKHWPGLKAFGFTRPPRVRDVAYTLAGGAVYVGLLVTVTSLAAHLFHIDLNQKQEIGFDSVVTSADRLMAFVSLVILPPIAEEILFRGVLYGGLRKRLSVAWAAFFTSLAFAFPHLLQGGSALLWVGAIDTFVLSLVLCALREKTGSLWSGIGLHMLKNGIAYLYLFILVTK